MKIFVIGKLGVKVDWGVGGRVAEGCYRFFFPTPAEHAALPHCLRSTPIVRNCLQAGCGWMASRGGLILQSEINDLDMGGRSGFSSTIIALSPACVPPKRASGDVKGCRARGNCGGQIPLLGAGLRRRGLLIGHFGSSAIR